MLNSKMLKRTHCSSWMSNNICSVVKSCIYPIRWIIHQTSWYTSLFDELTCTLKVVLIDKYKYYNFRFNYRMSPAEHEELFRQVVDLLSKNSYASLIWCPVPALLIPKKYGTRRMGVDSRAINKIPVRYLFLFLDLMIYSTGLSFIRIKRV